MNAANTPPRPAGATASPRAACAADRQERPGRQPPTPRQARDFDRLLDDKARREAEAQDQGEAAMPMPPAAPLSMPMPGLRAGPVSAEAEAMAEASSTQAAAARPAAGAAEAAAPAAGAGELSASALALQRQLQGVGAAGEPAAAQGSAALQALIGSGEARRFDVSIDLPLGVQLQLQATQAGQGAQAAQAAQVAQALTAGMRAAAPWVLSIGSTRADQAALARHLPRLEERLRSRGVQAAPLHWETSRDGEEEGA